MISLPIFFENSAVPKILSKVSPISIGAITVGPVVFCDSEISESLKRHESIHWEQYKECLIIGFLLLYAFFWIRNICKGMGGSDAYYNIPFEKEAYDNQENECYLLNRKRYSWV
jgi:hypothetical protein